MSPFDKTWNFKFAGYIFNFGYLKKGKVKMDGWHRIGKFYYALPFRRF